MNKVASGDFQKPQTLRQVADMSRSLGEFGTNLRDWQHVIARSVTSRSGFASRVAERPPLLRDRFPGGDIADAYLAAYAEWLCQQAKLVAPEWVASEDRSLVEPWYADSNHAQLTRLAPESFAIRGVYTAPDPVFTPKPGRPRVAQETSRQKRIERQRAYRKRIKALVEKARRS